MKLFRVRNFEKFQHYKDRNPPWIKLYRSLLDDPRFFQLSETDRFMLLGIFILASQTDNQLPNDQAWLKTKLLTKKPVPIELLVESEWLEWLEQSASKPASKVDSKAASTSASKGASTFASPRALAREEKSRGEKKRAEESPLLQSTQTLEIYRSVEEGGSRSKVTPETVENVWAAILHRLREGIRKGINPKRFEEYLSPLRLLSMDREYLTVRCQYDPGEDKEWLEQFIQNAAIAAGHDRGRKVRLAVLLPDTEDVLELVEP